MKVLILHQAYPAQFRSLGPALAARGDEVRALIMKRTEPYTEKGVAVTPYFPKRASTPGIHPWLIDFETQTVRAEAVFEATCRMRDGGFTPDVIVAHPGWGEALFIKNVWPNARLGVYCEFYYAIQGQDMGFDPEFPTPVESDVCRTRFKNLTNELSLGAADLGLSPTHWQASTYPPHLRGKIEVIHDGIDTALAAPDPHVGVVLPGDLRLTRADEVITFVNRSFEPPRGYHRFMRALPEILRRRPKARVLMIGSEGVSYGARPGGEASWMKQFIDEVRPSIPDEDWARVHFLGKVPYESFLVLMRLSSVHVYLTYPFVLSWSLIEAMSSGCAIVASDTRPVQEVIQDGQTGRLVDFFDTAGLAQTVCALLDDPAERARLGAAARAAAIAGYDLQTVCLPRQIAWVDRLARM